MKIQTQFKLRTIAGETIVVNQGTPDADMTRIISLNASARLLWEKLEGKEFTAEEVAGVLITTYGIDAKQAENDATAWIEAMKKQGIIIA